MLGVRLLADVQPELCCRYEPQLSGRLRRTRPPRRKELPPRPLRLLPRPIRLTVLPETEAAPQRIAWAGQQHAVRWSCGPERIETGWWRGRPVGRDYYRIRDHDGPPLLDLSPLANGQWFLHGMFE